MTEQNFVQNDSSLAEDAAVSSEIISLFDTIPISSCLWTLEHKMIYCNNTAVNFFEMQSRQDLIENYRCIFPENQPNGENTIKMARAAFAIALNEGECELDLTYIDKYGVLLPSKVFINRIEIKGATYIISYQKVLKEFNEIYKKVLSDDERMQTMLNTSPIACQVLDSNYVFLDANKKFYELFEYSSKEECTSSGCIIFPNRQPNGTHSMQEMAEKIKQAFKNGKISFEWTCCTKVGIEFPCIVFIERVMIADSHMFVIHLQDMSQQKILTDSINEANERFRFMVDSTPLGCVLMDDDYSVLSCNWHILKLFEVDSERQIVNNYEKFSPEYQPNGRLSNVMFNEQNKTVLKRGRARFRWMHQTLSGQPIPCEVTLVRMTQHGKSFIVGFLFDLREISQAVEMLNQLEKKVSVDYLTSIHNRLYFSENSVNLFEKSNVENSDLSLIMFDLDFFKRINDTYGHQVGDEVLKAIAKSVKTQLRDCDLFARYGGEEFIIMLPNTTLDGAEKIAERIRITIENLIVRSGGFDIKVTLSLGLSDKKLSSKGISQMLHQADLALYQAKASGRNCIVSYKADAPTCQ